METGGDPSRPQGGTDAGDGGIPADGVAWTAEEDKILRVEYERYVLEEIVAALPALAVCVAIAAALPNKTVFDVALRCEWLLMNIKESKKRTRDGQCISERIRHPSNSHMLPVAHMSSDGIDIDRDDVDVRRNLLDLIKDNLEQVGENLEANENLIVLCNALRNIAELMKYYSAG
ncbi:Homeobox-like domain-containing protein [Dioscorea alata]|uniref:Homeobox-like domain-containing protein n=3 Tax=Dioscorea alata TaxID=55571 RepID=A0ACB7VBF0_DIOAL|nr:Homeobox-like domain-containing protein [Dioscorea alata]KAH7670876.1 Homeobox-like domain-containing protein [Dioscorea alata]KAH7670877.1 Homeobox-like domain-containing protein [Dioscorea alata]